MREHAVHAAAAHTHTAQHLGSAKGGLVRLSRVWVGFETRSPLFPFVQCPRAPSCQKQQIGRALVGGEVVL